MRFWIVWLAVGVALLVRWPALWVSESARGFIEAGLRYLREHPR